MRTRILFTSLAVATTAGVLHADTVYKTDGSTIDKIDIQSERLDKVEYRDDKRKTSSIDSDEVLFIEFTSKPQLIDRADTAIDEDRLLDAQADLENFIEGVKDSGAPRKWPWSRAYALYRLLEVHEIMGELDRIPAVADRLGELEPDSRYLPFAMMKKAQALFDAQKGAASLSTLDDLGRMIESKGLSDRWKLEKELGAILFDSSLSDAKRQEKLTDVSARAGVHYPVVRNKAEVSLGEALLLGNELTEAEKVFRGVTADPKADARTLAAAWTGLGSCLFARGESKAADEAGKAILREARTAFMRVVVVYKNELRYVPKAMFFAGRCFQLIGEEGADEYAEKLYRKLIRTFRGDRWEAEARGFLPSKKKQGGSEEEEEGK